MPTAVILSGHGRYDDPFHPFIDTSQALADLLVEEGLTVEIVHDTDARLAAGLDGVDLLVVHTGDPWRSLVDATLLPERERRTPAPEVLEAERANLAAAVERGIGLLGIHAAAASLRDLPQWRELLDGEWNSEVSFHPPLGVAELHVHRDAHPIVAGADDFSLVDERYTDLVLGEHVEPLVEHTYDGERHPLVWARETGRTRLVYDALGHDLRSYESPEHVALLRRAVAWLLEERA
ncbi:ThuA domain-containing protein [Agromyces sp. SYSU T00194]|uniref:ThuA domain-containing protein n=1 Tax=Agromyces chitinivorans TaxID=3158560 RepID=UPI003397BB97